MGLFDIFKKSPPPPPPRELTEEEKREQAEKKLAEAKQKFYAYEEKFFNGDSDYGNTRKTIEILAEDGDPKALFYMGLCYEYGYFFDYRSSINIEKATQYYQLSRDGGCELAEFYINSVLLEYTEEPALRSGYSVTLCRLWALDVVQRPELNKLYVPITTWIYDNGLEDFVTAYVALAILLPQLVKGGDRFQGDAKKTEKKLRSLASGSNWYAKLLFGQYLYLLDSCTSSRVHTGSSLYLKDAVENSNGQPQCAYWYARALLYYKDSSGDINKAISLLKEAAKNGHTESLELLNQL